MAASCDTAGCRSVIHPLPGGAWPARPDASSRSPGALGARHDFHGRRSSLGREHAVEDRPGVAAVLRPVCVVELALNALLGLLESHVLLDTTAANPALLRPLYAAIPT